MKILLATDNSQPALEAAKFVAELPLRDLSDAVVLRVVAGRDVPARVGMHPGWARVVEQLAVDADKEAQQAADILKPAVGNVETIVEKGHPGETVVEHGDSHDIDLTVVGAIGHSAIRRIMLGSVSDYIATHAVGSTLVHRASKDRPAGPLRLLIAYDGSAAANAMVDQIATVFDSTGVEITLIAVVEEIGAIAAEFAEAAQDAWNDSRNAAETSLNEAATSLRERGFEVLVELIASEHVGDELCAQAKQRSADIVVVGDQGHSAVERFVLGSVSRYVLRHCDQSVWISRVGKA